MKATANAVRRYMPLSLQAYLYRAGASYEVPGSFQVIMNPELDDLPHQLGDLNNLLRNGSWGLFSEPGCGKTLPAQAYALHNVLLGYKVLVLMPPVLLHQFVHSLHWAFQGSEKLVSPYILREPPYPQKASKKKVQEAIRAIHHGNPPAGIPPAILDLLRRLDKAVPLEFSDSEIQEIRSSRAKPEELAERLWCSADTIKKIRKGTFRQDLFNTWSEENSWPSMLLMSYQFFIRVNKEVTPHYQTLIADEVHEYLCHPSSQTWKKVRHFLQGDPKRQTEFVPMTGTPMPNVPTDAYGVIKLLYPDSYSSLREFERLHVSSVMQEDRSGRKFQVVIGYRNLEHLRRTLFANASRVTKEQVFTLDRPVIREIEVELSPEHMALYRKLVRERVLEVKGETISAVQASSLRQKALQIATYPDPFSNHPIKEIAVRDVIDQLLREIDCKHREKVVIFAIYNNTIEAMAEWFKEYNPALVYGGSNTQKNVEKFKTDDSCRLMLAHYKSGGVGLNLQDQCRYVICAEPTSVPGQFTQATERVYRKGQTKVVTFYLLKVARTLWPKVVESMKGKMSLTQKVTMDKSELLAELLGE